MITKSTLITLYSQRLLSMQQIATHLGYSLNQVNYWMAKYQIPRRNRSQAVYARHHPNGDPFKASLIDSIEKATLYGMGVGLYWGEGTKRSKSSVRLGNSDPLLILTFMDFLTQCYGVKKDDLRFGLQLFTDIDVGEVMNFWVRKLGVRENQFYKPHITISGSLGTYRRKSKYGVVTLYYNNSRLRDILVSVLPR